MSETTDGRWTTRKTVQRMHDGNMLPAYDVVDEAGNIVARVHAIGPGEIATVERRARMLAAAPTLGGLLLALCAEVRAHGTVQHATVSEAEAELRAIVHGEPRPERKKPCADCDAIEAGRKVAEARR